MPSDGVPWASGSSVGVTGHAPLHRDSHVARRFSESKGPQPQAPSDLTAAQAAAAARGHDSAVDSAAAWHHVRSATPLQRTCTGSGPGGGTAPSPSRACRSFADGKPTRARSASTGPSAAGSSARPRDAATWRRRSDGARSVRTAGTAPALGRCRRAPPRLRSHGAISLSLSLWHWHAFHADRGHGTGTLRSRESCCRSAVVRKLFRASSRRLAWSFQRGPHGACRLSRRQHPSQSRKLFRVSGHWQPTRSARYAPPVSTAPGSRRAAERRQRRQHASLGPRARRRASAPGGRALSQRCARSARPAERRLRRRMPAPPPPSWRSRPARDGGGPQRPTSGREKAVLSRQRR